MSIEPLTSSSTRPMQRRSHSAKGSLTSLLIGTSEVASPRAMRSTLSSSLSSLIMLAASSLISALKAIESMHATPSEHQAVGHPILPGRWGPILDQMKQA
ncbi:hypothetical protein FRB95_003854 [Tulasnella sp. JGI-2019a]|nr:hypothetical protein FRB95_003854 [Tulasnella sp. JGI-2019a]